MMSKPDSIPHRRRPLNQPTETVALDVGGLSRIQFIKAWLSLFLVLALIGMPAAIRAASVSPAATFLDEGLRQCPLCDLPTPRNAGVDWPVPTDTVDHVSLSRVTTTYGNVPLSFESNAGQTDPQVKFLARGPGYTLFLTSTEAVTVLRPSGPAAEAAVLRMKLVGANPDPTVTARELLPGKHHNFVGNDPGRWRTDIPTYARVEYRDVYPGITLICYGTHRQLEYDFVVAPGADPSNIKLAFQKARGLRIDADGNLIVDTAAGELSLREPVMYQEIRGARRAIPGGYVLTAQDQVGFRVAAYDPHAPLIIDPVLSYSTYLGGSGFNADDARAIAVDAAGHAYVTGMTGSADFPTANPLQPNLKGLADVFVTKFNPSGSALVYSTFLGGSATEIGFGIAVDADGNVYVTGETFSTDFPTVNALQPQLGGSSDAFVAKLNPTGSALVYSTYLGGSGSENPNEGGIAVDAAGNAYVTGRTASIDFPTTPGAFQRTFGGGFSDAFVAKVNPTGSALVYSTYLGGSGSEFPGSAIAVDADSNAYVTGETTSTNFPTTPGAFQPAHAGGFVDAYVAKLNPTGSALVYSTYLGGSASDIGKGIAVDAVGNAYVTGGTGSLNFPTTPGAFQTTFAGGFLNVYVTKLNPSGSALVYSTYIGGTGAVVNGDLGWSIVVDTRGRAYVAGETTSADFPTQHPFQPFQGRTDAFVLTLDTIGSALLYSTYLGGRGQDIAHGIALDHEGNAYVAGVTDSLDFPTVNAFQPAHGGGQFNAFVAKFSAVGPQFRLVLNASSFVDGDTLILQLVGHGDPGGTNTGDLFVDLHTGGPTGFRVLSLRNVTLPESELTRTLLNGTIRGLPPGSYVLSGVLVKRGGSTDTVNDWLSNLAVVGFTVVCEDDSDRDSWSSCSRSAVGGQK